MNWFLTPEVRASAPFRLFCLPYAGGSAAVYREWGRILPGEVEMHAVQLPGRGWRLGEKPSSDLVGLADEVAGAIAARADRPFALFGHSMGSWLAFLVAGRLERLGQMPRVLFASGRQGPSVGCTEPPMSHYSDPAFVEQVQVRYGGIPAAILEHPDVLELLLPALRADVEALERYVHRPGTPLRCPVVAMGGTHDRLVSQDQLASWALETSGPFRVETFPGGHFYFQEDPTTLLRCVADGLAGRVPSPEGCARP